MSLPLHRALLLISDSEDWREAMSLGFEVLRAAGHADGVAGLDPFTIARASGSKSLSRAAEITPVGFVIDVDAGMEQARANDRLDRAEAIARPLREAYAVPVVFVTSLPIDGLNALSDKIGLASVLLARSLDVLEVAADITGAVAGLVGAAPVEPFATVEVTINEGTIEWHMRAGAYSKYSNATWNAFRSIELMDKEFSLFEATSDNFKTLNVDRIKLAGERLLVELFAEPLAQADAFCRAKMPDQKLIHHRVVIGDGMLPFVPFEVVLTRNQDEYLRFVNPIARRLISRQQHRSPDRPPSRERPRRRVLFIVSKASGVIEVPHETFKGQPSPSLGVLKTLDDELVAVKAHYRDDEFTTLVLDANDPIGALEQVFEDSAFDIIHFAGHSIRADSQHVYLALPARPGFPVVALETEDFARLASNADARLVILSSCEGASGLAISRLASFGIPAVIGFRWPVIDAQANVFTAKLHAALRRGGVNVPISTAFHQALVSLNARTRNQLTGFSPVLTIQRSTWHNFAVES